MNRITFDGRIGNDAEVRFTPAGKAVCAFSVASDIGFGDNKKTNWFRCQIWGERGEKLSPHLLKGTQVTIYGALELREWDKDGVKQISPDVRVDDVSLHGGKPQGDSAPPKAKQNNVPMSKRAPNFDDMDGEIPF